jgi:hypothetical protein
MPQTTNFAITYPDSGDHVRLWEHLQQLAEDVDGALEEVRTGIMADPITNAGAGTPTSSTTEVRDAVLGDYVFTAVAGRRYQVVLTGGMSSSVANDVYEVNVRDGGGSTPTSGSTLVAQNLFLLRYWNLLFSTRIMQIHLGRSTNMIVSAACSLMPIVPP